MKKVLKVFFIYFVVFLGVFFSKDMSDGARTGIQMCINSLIPSLFIFLIIANIIANSKLKRYLAMPFLWLFKILFKANYNETAIILLSLIGGYPVGAKLLSNAVKHNTITVDKATYMLSFCVNCGPSFTITFIGLTIFSNKNVGIIIYVSQIIACLIVGFIVMHFFYNTEKSEIKQEININFGSCEFVNCVVDSSRSMLTISAFVVAFCSLMGLIQPILKKFPINISIILNGFFEVSGGVNMLKNTNISNAILYASVITSFGGICVILQICAMLKNSNIKISMLLKMRLIYVIISVVVTYFLQNVFPQEMNCFSISNANITKTFSISPISTMFLIVLSIMLLFFSKKSAKITV